MKRFFLIYLFPICLFSQSPIGGTLLDKETKQPVAYAHVFLSDSSAGTFSNADGVFSILPKNSSTLNQVIITHVGYQLKEIDLPLLEKEIFLDPEKNQLTTIEVKGDVDKKWKKEYKTFKKELFGSSPFAKECKILNPWVINFSKQKGFFIATAEENIQVANEALGYNISFKLDYLASKYDVVTIKGFPQELKDLSQNEDLLHYFNRNRQEAFKGSIYHLAQCLSNDTFKENGFKLYFIGDELVDALNPQSTKGTHKRIQNSNEFLVKRGGKKYFKFDGIIQVVYSDPLSKRAEVSWIKKEGTPFLSNGVIENQEQLKLYGSFSKDRLANYLPVDLLKSYFRQQQEIQSLSDLVKSKLNPTPKEKIYIHTDRDLYFPGEDLWIKGYISDSFKPSQHSFKLHVELVGKDTSHVQAILPIENGVASGYLTIPENIPSDYYHIVGYTDYSKEQSSVHYNKVIQVGIFENGLNTNAKSKNGTLKFFPEGGEIISGISNTIAFELRDENSIALNGTVTLFEDSTALLSSATIWEGKGFFSFVPNTGSKYYLQSVDREINSVNFSAGEGNIGMRIKPLENDYKIELMAKNVVMDSIFVTTSSNYSISDIHPIFLEKQYAFRVSKEHLDEGVNTITVFNSELDPILERVVYVPPTIPDINFTMEVSSYNEREIIITGEDVVRSASLSVIDLNHTDENNFENILVNTFLRPEIKGRISQAHQIFHEPNEKHLELLMLVNGWRQIKPIKQDTVKSENIQKGFNVSGSVISKKLRKLVGSNIYMINRGAEKALRTSTINSDGSIFFENTHLSDSSKLFFAFDPKLSNLVTDVTLNANHDWKYSNGFKSRNSNPTLGSERRARNYEKQQAFDSAFENNARLLEEVVVLGREGSSLKTRRYSVTSAEILSFKEKPIKGYGRSTFTEIDRGIKSIKPIFFYEVGGAVIRDIKLINTEQPDGITNEISLVVDNYSTQPLELFYMDPKSIERVEFVRSQGRNGTLFIYTREKPEKKHRKSLFEAKLKGYQLEKDFYTEDLIFRQTKHLRTIYWNPYIDEENRQSTFEFQDSNAKMKAILEGFTKGNKPFRIVKTY